MILFLFGLMLTKAPIGRDSLDGKNRAVGVVVAAAVVRRARLPDPGRVPRRATRSSPPIEGGSVAIGEALFRDYVLPFEAVSFLLLAALIGAIVLARKDEVDR